MLDGGADARQEERREDGPEARRVPESDERDAGDERAERERIALAEALGDESRGDLEHRHGRAVRRADETDLGERKAERLRKQRQQHVAHVRQAVVQRMRRAARGESALLHRDQGSSA